MGPRLLERIRTSCGKCRNTARSSSGPHCGQERQQQKGVRKAGEAEGHILWPLLPQSRQLPPPCSKLQGCLPTYRSGSQWPKGAKKEQEAAAAEPQEPFYCRAEQGTAPYSSRKGRDTRAYPRAQPEEHERGGTGSPTSSLLLTQTLQQRPGSQAGWGDETTPCATAEDRTQLSRTFLLLSTLQPSPTLRDSLCQELTEPKGHSDPSGQQRKE